jgi:ribonuclease D
MWYQWGFSVAHCGHPINPALETTKKDPLPPDELERLEQFHQEMKDETEAWQKLLENLDKLKSKRTENHQPPKPTKQ